MEYELQKFKNVEATELKVHLEAIKKIYLLWKTNYSVHH